MSLHWGLYQPAAVVTIEGLKLCLDSGRSSSTILTKYRFDNTWFNSPLSLTSGFLAGQNWEILFAKAAIQALIYPGTPCALHWSQVFYFWQQLCVVTVSPLLWEDKFYLWMLNEEMHLIFRQPVGPGQGATALVQGRCMSNALLRFKQSWTAALIKVQPLLCCATCKEWNVNNSCLFLFKICSRTAKFWTRTLL